MCLASTLLLKGTLWPCCLQKHTTQPPAETLKMLLFAGTHLVPLLQGPACWPGPPLPSSPALASAADHLAALHEQRRIAQPNVITLYNTIKVWTEGPTPAQAIGSSIRYVQTRNTMPAQASGRLSGRPASEAEKQHTRVQRHAMRTFCSAIACTAAMEMSCCSWIAVLPPEDPAPFSNQLWTPPPHVVTTPKQVRDDIQCTAQHLTLRDVRCHTATQ
jgi:hypothetical protein